MKAGIEPLTRGFESTILFSSKTLSGVKDSFPTYFFSLPIVFILSLQMNDSTTNSQSQILLVARDKWNFFVLRRFAACACVGVQVGVGVCNNMINLRKSVFFYMFRVR